MLSLPQQGFPVTCRSGHCCVCSPLLFASDILCDLPTVNRGWIQLAQGPVTKNIALQIFESASLLVCKSASLQVCRSAFVAHRCLTRTTIDSRQCCSFVAQTCLQICVCRTPICHTYNYWLTAMLLICCPNLSADLRLSHTDMSHVQLLTHGNVAHLLPKLACIIVQMSENYSSTFFVEKLFDPPEKSPNVPSV